MRSAPALLVLVSVVACRSGPAIVPGPPVHLGFAPPAGLMQQERYHQRRSVRLEFREAPTQLIVDELSGFSEERYEPLPDGGFRVKSVLLSETAVRNGRRVPPPYDLTGLEFAIEVDAQGRFQRVSDVDRSVSDLLSRVQDPNTRDALRALLTVDAFEKRLRTSWDARFEGICNRDLAPGDSFLRLDDQEIPFGGSVRTVARQQVAGVAADATRDLMSLRLSFGGRGSADVDEAQALGLFADVEGGRHVLTDAATGDGERYVSTRTCQTAREQAHLTGTIRLKSDITSGSLPTVIEFDVERELSRGPAGGPASPAAAPR